MNVLWIGYGPLNETYNHPGRATKGMLKKIIENGNKVFFIEGVIEKFRVKQLKQYSSSLWVISGFCPWNKSGLLSKIFARIRWYFYGARQYNIIKKIIKVDVKNKNLIIVVDHIFFLPIAIRLANYYHCLLVLRMYGIWDIFESKFKINDLKDFLMSKKFFKNIELFNSFQGEKKIIITQDGTQIGKLYNILCRNKVKSCIFKELKNAHSITNFEGKLLLQQPNFNIIYMSVLSKGKQSFLIMKLIERMKNKNIKLYVKTKFTIIGEGEQYDKMIRYSKNNSFSEKVIFTGYLSKREIIQKYLASADVMIAINSYNPVLEALSEGIPVIINEFGEVERLFQGVFGLSIVGKNIKKIHLSTQQQEDILKEYEFAIYEIYKKLKNLDYTSCYIK